MVVAEPALGRLLERELPFKLAAWVECSPRNLEVETPDGLYDRPEVFGILDDLTTNGKLRYYGVSVETADEALAALRCPRVQSIQIIFNMFRLKPIERVFPEAAKRQVGILARVPLASGLLTGKLRADTTFAADDHRLYNREGQKFDKGETLSGISYDIGLEAVERRRRLVPSNATMAHLGLRWILMFDAVTSTIPGAKDPAQAEENTAVAALAPLDAAVMEAVRQVYDELIRPSVDQHW